jgi:hypothetical protein
MEGPAENQALCTASGDGIDVIGVNNVEILGPGIIKEFPRWGILLAKSTGDTVRLVTAAKNCWSGLQTSHVSDSKFEENIWASNAVNSSGAPCGGICLSNSQKNLIRKSKFNGNGRVEEGDNNFGIGLEGNCSGNIIENNEIGGNVSGVRVFPEAMNNIVRRNTIVANPPAQVRDTFPTANGRDIYDMAPPGMNTFEDNICLTYSGGQTPPPCPNVSRGNEESQSHSD